MKKCVCYQSKLSCAEVVGQPMVLVNNLLEVDPLENNEWQFVNKRFFSSFYQGESGGWICCYPGSPTEPTAVPENLRLQLKF